MSMGTPEKPQWFSDLDQASNREQPMAVPIYTGDYSSPDIWYQEGVGYVNHEWKQIIGLPASFTIMSTLRSTVLQEKLAEWRKVRDRLAAGEDIMDIEVPDENYQGNPYLPIRTIARPYSSLSRNIPITRSRGFGYEPDSNDFTLKPKLLGAEMLEILREQDWGNGITLHIDTANYGHTPVDKSAVDKIQQARELYEGTATDSMEDEV